MSTASTIAVAPLTTQDAETRDGRLIGANGVGAGAPAQNHEFASAAREALA
ncbi:hypothetical protein [Streptomyces sp. NRRL S-118]|uniref:hypothetical protein n=1 Tax=Streptomyces sp. NRRL S-118 TaxID=1463881 RepID=UPI000B1A6751